MWGGGGETADHLLYSSLSRNCSQQFQLSKKKLFLKFIFVKFCTFSYRKCGVVVEVQTGIIGANGSSPGNGHFIKNVFLLFSNLA